MPIYAFQCAACGHSFDRLQKLSDADPSACPECGAEQVKRQLTAPQFRLAGGGWYETDFKKDGDKKRNLAGDGGAAGSGEGKASEGKSSEGGGSEQKASESKSGEGKPSDSKSASQSSGQSSSQSAASSTSNAGKSEPAPKPPAAP